MLLYFISSKKGVEQSLRKGDQTQPGIQNLRQLAQRKALAHLRLLLQKAASFYKYKVETERKEEDRVMKGGEKKNRITASERT